MTISASRSRRIRLHLDLRPHQDGAAPGVVGRTDTAPPDDGTAGREIRTRYDFCQGVGVDVGVIDQGERRIDDFAEIVRRDIGGHADRDPAGPVDQKVRVACGEDDGLTFLAVVVRLEVDRVLVDIFDESGGRPREPGFGVTHRGRRIAID